VNKWALHPYTRQEFRDLFSSDHDCPALVISPVFFEIISFNSIRVKGNQRIL
jgi:hypothetical protein